MGVDFILKAGETFRKGWDREREKLSERTLLSSTPQEVRTIPICPVNGSHFDESDYKLEAKDERILVYRNRELVGICDTPPPSVLKCIKELGGKALGTLNRIHPRSGRVDIAVELES